MSTCQRLWTEWSPSYKNSALSTLSPATCFSLLRIFLYVYRNVRCVYQIHIHDPFPFLAYSFSALLCPVLSAYSCAPASLISIPTPTQIKALHWTGINCLPMVWCRMICSCRLCVYDNSLHRQQSSFPSNTRSFRPTRLPSYTVRARPMLVGERCARWAHTHACSQPDRTYNT